MISNHLLKSFFSPSAQGEPGPAGAAGEPGFSGSGVKSSPNVQIYMNNNVLTQLELFRARIQSDLMVCFIAGYKRFSRTSRSSRTERPKGESSLIIVFMPSSSKDWPVSGFLQQGHTGLLGPRGEFGAAGIKVWDWDCGSESGIKYSTAVKLLYHWPK